MLCSEHSIGLSENQPLRENKSSKCFRGCALVIEENATRLSRSQRWWNLDSF